MKKVVIPLRAPEKPQEGQQVDRVAQAKQRISQIVLAYYKAAERKRGGTRHG